MVASPRFLTIALLLAATIHAADGVALRYHLQPGTAFRDTWSGSVRAEDGPPGVPALIYTMVWCTDYEVLAVDPDGAITLKQTYVSEQTTITQATRHWRWPRPMQVFDSLNPQDPTHHLTRERLAHYGRHFQFTLETDGRVRSIEGLDRMINQIVLFAQTLPEREAEFREQLNRRFDPVAVRVDLESRFRNFPDDPARLDEPWERDFDTLSWIPNRIHAQVIPKAIDDAAVHVAFVGRLMDSPLAKPRQLEDGLERWTGIRGDSHGTFSIDRKTGWKTAQTILENLSAAHTLSHDNAPEHHRPYRRWAQVMLNSERRANATILKRHPAR